MAPRMYTLDSKLLCGSPEIRIGEKIYAVDDRKNTVKKAMKLFNEKKNDTEKDEFDYIDELFKLAFGENASIGRIYNSNRKPECHTAHQRLNHRHE